jgi:hypothetical protein
MLLFTPWRIVGMVFGLLVIGIPLVAVIFFLLAVSGGPGTCEVEGRPIEGSAAEAASFQQKWDQLNGALDAGQPSSATFTEGEATGRARQWVDEHDVPVSDLVLCFSAEDGGAAYGKVDVPFFPGDVDVLVRGTVDLTGEHPDAEIDKMEAGNLPGPLTNLVENFINTLIDDQANDIDLDHDYGVEFADGNVTITGQP